MHRLTALVVVLCGAWIAGFTTVASSDARVVRSPFAHCGAPIIGAMPDWGPVGNEIAYVRYPVAAAGDFSIWRMKSDGTHQRRVTADTPLAQLFPAWSPEGTEIAFDGGLDHQVFLVEAAGGSPRLLTFGGEPGWFADGSQLVVDRSYDNGTLAIVTRSGSDVRTFHSAWASSNVSATPDVSPDGRAIVYAAAAFGFGESLRLIGPDGTGDRWIVDPFNSANTSPNGDGARWSPNGRWIAFSEAYPGDGTAALALVKPDGSGFRLLTSRAGATVSPSWSPDGRRLVFVRQQRDPQAPGPLWIIGQDGRAAHPIAPGCLFGTPVRDRLTPSPRQRGIYAFGGNDVVNARDRRREFIDCGTGRDRVIADESDRIARNCERVFRRLQRR
jgi:Tol biopolymer transport system component